MSPQPRASAENGVTLVELLVYSVLLVTVLLIVGTIMISTQNIGLIVRESTTTASAAQLAATSIETGVRNATAVKLTDIGDDQLLQVRTAGADPNNVVWRCQSWYFSDSAGTIRYLSSASDAVPVASPIGEPTNWGLLVNNVEPSSGSGIFTQSGNSITMDFHGTTADSAPVVIRTSVVPRTESLESASCF
jgi:hypothetical protein